MISPAKNSSLTRKPLTVDFVVIGGGMAGVSASLAAARNGASVVLVQDRSVLGGNASSEVKMHIVGADCHRGRPGARESGLIEELRLEDAYRNPQRCYSLWDLLLYEKVKAEPKVTLLLDTTCIGCKVNQETGGIVSVEALSNSTEELFEITGRFFADCSGDSRLGLEAGADFRMGREGREEHGESLARAAADDQTLGSTILMTAKEHPEPQPFHCPDWARKFTKEELKHRPIHSYEYGYWWMEWGGQLDTVKDNAAIRHELLRIAFGIWDYIKNSGEHPDSQNWALDWMGAIPGKRESRRLLGPHILTQHDILEGRMFPDAVAYGGWAIDLHPPNGVDASEEPPYTPTRFGHLYSIPFRSLHSRNVPNLLFAGRNISATHVAFASTRVMATCSIMGQAIGTAAALACRGELPLTAFESGEPLLLLQRQLLKDDAFIPTLANDDPADQARRAVAICASSNQEDYPAHLVIDGVTRDLIGRFGAWADGKPHHWRSCELPATLELRFEAPVKVSEIHLTFDSGFQRELTLSPSHQVTRNLIRAAQPELVRSYRIYAGGKLIHTQEANYLRKRVHWLAQPVESDKITIEVLETHGVPEARIFEVRLYYGIAD